MPQQQPVSLRYQHDLASGKRRPDTAQASAVLALAQLQKALAVVPKTGGLFARLLGRPAAGVRGLYMWGGVGRGKTYLMDLFFDTLPEPRKQRLHFHRFMHWLHGELKKRKGEANPLQIIGQQLAAETRVLCFDEFFVSDIGDAMLLAGLLDSLFAHGVVLVATSNVAPTDLYRNGLARDNFLPAIALIEQHCLVMEVDGGTDYRLRDLKTNGVFLDAGNPDSETILHQRFRLYAGHEHAGEALLINDRQLHVRHWADGIAWFDFRALCESPRAAADYIELARLFHTVLVSDVPQLTAARDDAARRFIALVDEFYERHVKLTLSCAVKLDDIYTGEQLAFPFQRTRSRLEEMQTEAYLAKAHLP